MARSGLTGDFRKLAEFAGKLKRTDKVLTTVAKNMCEEALTLVADGFQAETDPYGKAWAKLKVRQGKILQDKGRLKNSWHRVQVSAAGFRIAAGVDYATYHQSGTRRMVARRMVPDGGRLPQAWRAKMIAAATEVLEDHFRG